MTGWRIAFVATMQPGFFGAVAELGHIFDVNIQDKVVMSMRGSGVKTETLCILAGQVARLAAMVDVSFFWSLACDDDASLFTVRSLPRPVSWLSSHPKNVNAAVTGSVKRCRIREPKPKPNRSARRLAAVRETMQTVDDMPLLRNLIICLSHNVFAYFASNCSTTTNADVRHVSNVVASSSGVQTSNAGITGTENDLLNANYVIRTDNPFALSDTQVKCIWCVSNPRRAFLTVALGEVTEKPTLEWVLERTKRNPEGRVRHRRDLQDKINAIRLVEKENKEKELQNQIIEEGEMYKRAFHEKRHGDKQTHK
ncbi:hypothetical protein Tco_1170591 [Tanacetum coccineum]